MAVGSATSPVQAWEDLMLVDFFFALREAKLPVSVKEYLLLLEGLQRHVIGPSMDEFYYLARAALVKDEQLYDKFDRAFGAYFSGIDAAIDLTADVPADWLVKRLQRELSEEEKALVESLGGWDALMKRLEE